MRILFVSGSFGLGHVTRDLAIARALRAQAPGIEIAWLAGEPARSTLREAGQALHPAADRYQSDSDPADGAATTGGLNIFRYLLRARAHWAANARMVEEIVRAERFDALVGDETYEVSAALIRGQISLPVPYVIILDFIGLDAMTRNPLEKLGTSVWNRLWVRDRKMLAGGRNRALFVGEAEDIPDRAMGLGLPSRREHALRYYRFLGYVLPFDLAEVADRRQLRAELGYGEGPLVVVSIGGTAVGRDVLEACGRAFPLVRARSPALEMVLVCGPRIDPQSVAAPPGVRVLGYVPRLYRHLAACDLAVVQAGGTTTIELTALRRPFVYVPIEGQCEQELAVSGRLARHGAGIRHSRPELTPERVAELILANVGAEVTWPPIPVDGAAVAARTILEAIGSARPIAA
jgi:UDP:flavonoid glycosyltransferase YjiC (YdhE family)